MRRLLLTLTALVLLAVPAASADTRAPIAQFARESAVREYAGHILVSRFDVVTERYQLVVVRPDGTQQALPVPTSSSAFDADIGPGPDGRPAVVYSLCGESRATRDDCDLAVVGLNGGAPRALAAANTPEQAEYAPSIWRRRIAFVRSTKSPVVYTRPLNAPRSVRSRRQDGVPRARCSGIGDPPKTGKACTTQSRSVEETELFGDLLALGVGYYVPNQSGQGTDEIRLDDVAKGGSRRVALLVYGEGGQQLIGLSFAQGRLGWTKSCYGDPGGCENNGPYRYRYRSDRYERATGRYVPMSGFAIAGGAYIGLRGGPELGDGGGPTFLERVTGTAWRPVARERIRD